MTNKEILYIEGELSNDHACWGMPNDATIHDIQAATTQVLSNEIPAFQVGPKIGSSMLGTLMVLHAVETSITSALRQSLSDDAVTFRYTKQKPRPIYHELIHMAPQIPLEQRANYRRPPHVDEYEWGLAVHHEYGTKVRSVELATMRPGVELAAERDIQGMMTNTALYYDGEGLGNFAYRSVVEDIYRGHTMNGVLTIFSEGNMQLDALDGPVRPAAHYFGHDPKIDAMHWTRYSSPRTDQTCSEVEKSQASARFTATYMHLHSALTYKRLVEQGIPSVDIASVAMIDSKQERTHFIDALMPAGQSVAELHRYVDHPGRFISYGEDTGPFFVQQKDLQ